MIDNVTCMRVSVFFVTFRNASLRRWLLLVLLHQQVTVTLKTVATRPKCRCNLDRLYHEAIPTSYICAARLDG
jgi:hypothetical protein